MAKSMYKTGGVSNKNAPATVSPTSKGKPMHGLNSPAGVSPTSYNFGGPVSKEVSNMIHSKYEMPNGKQTNA